MARFKKPKPQKIKRRPERWCHLCLAEITDDMTADSWVFLTHRPCTVPGWQALAIAGVWDPAEAGLPVVWGTTIAVACPACWPTVPDYLAGIDLIMEDESAEATPQVRSHRPLTTAEIEYVLDKVAEGNDMRVTVTTGHWVEEEDREALEAWEFQTWDDLMDNAEAARAEREEAANSEGDG